MKEEYNIKGIASEVITELAQNAAKCLYNKIKNFVIDSHYKDEIDFGNAFEDYLNYSKNINEKVKTLLYRREAKSLYSFFEYIDLFKENKSIPSNDINKILCLGNRLIITGTGGAGKSVLMKHFFLNTINNTNYIPVLIEMRGMNEKDVEGVDLVDYIYYTMKSQKFSIDKKYFEYSLDTVKYVFLMDGFDEVRHELSEHIMKEIIILCRKYPQNYYIITSRPLQEFVGWHDFQELTTRPFTKKQALSLIKKLEYDPDIKNKFYNDLDKFLFNDNKYKSFASNPLLLTIMLITYENRFSLPSNFNDFFEQAFTTLFHSHDATKSGFKRIILSKLGYEDFKKLFSYLCFKSYFNGEYSFSESRLLKYIEEAKIKHIIQAEYSTEEYLEDLTVSVCVLLQEGLNYYFTHRSFQEYFAACFAVQLDDEKQKMFFSLWLKEKTIKFTGIFLDMLYELEPSRFIKNIVAPGVLELEKLYIENENSDEWLINNFGGNVSIKVNNKMGVKYISTKIKNFYYTHVVLLACRIGGLTVKRIGVDDDKLLEIASRQQELIRNLEKKYSLNQEITFEQIKEDGYYYQLLEGMYWITERYNFAIKFIHDFLASNQKGYNNYIDMLGEI
ncbi:MAG: hypothetical protein J1E64_03160 [Acetatifactor sp.]|nr:hypothetical protein [Acetatifactor sp.]